MAEELRLPAREALRIDEVLIALGHPVRLRVVRTLADGREMACRDILPDMTKSSASHHWKVLRESGVIHQRREGRCLRTTLRRDDLDARFPGLLDAVVNG
ncbi:MULTISPECIES: ArsR/SmtB family transcription factor [Streptomyces]|uniref:Transcriptional regulator n=1 Tax=Streptomyces cacaoi TaxID=1898 RepID=A0A4Y3R4F7_STRCI|nr:MULTISPECIES: helix-turn-helix domain-containing protein [Streptomyces]NNG89305.1 helix-turn-helix transcriptional regulator [Streptomyces cacaoi]QHF96483.1 ArsR family transcriptional regulator [Streptomyces sp. NHF165]GEB52515.1 transcriptional regulator [Streptomyces cacaoi]